MEIDPLKLLKKLEPDILPSSAGETVRSSQAQQNSPVNDELNGQHSLKSQIIENTNKARPFQQIPNDSVIKGNYMPSLCISKKEYEVIVNQRPLIKFRPVRNSLIKSRDKALLATSLGIDKSEVDETINRTINYMLYAMPYSMYYDPQKIKDDLTRDLQFENSMLERQIIEDTAQKRQEQEYYKERAGVITPYVYRHGTKEQLTECMKMQLSDAKSALKNLYNILDTEAGGLYSYFERPIHVLDNRTILKMQGIVENGLGQAHKEGYMNEQMYTQNVEWAMQKIYDIQSNTRFRAAVKYAYHNS